MRAKNIRVIKWSGVVTVVDDIKQPVTELG